jgi:hypothetical protein
MKHAGPAPILRGFSEALGFWGHGSGRKNLTRRKHKLGNTKQPTTQKMYNSHPVLYWHRLCENAHVCPISQIQRNTVVRCHCPINAIQMSSDGSMLTSLGSAHATIMCGGSSQ